MEETLPQMNQWPNLPLNVELYPPVEITRKFSAPVEEVWRAWTSPEMIKQWWGPEGYTCPEASTVVRPGGKSIMAMKSPEGKVQYSGGTYLEVIPNEKLVTTDEFMDKDGKFMTAKEAGMPGDDWPDTLKITIEFKSLGANESQIHLVHEGIPQNMHDDCVDGWSTSIDKMQKLVERH